MHDRLVAEPIRLTYKDYCVLPEDGRRYEILDGDLYTSPSPVPLHQRVALRLGRIIQDFVEVRALGEAFIAPIDVLLGENDVVVPDLVYVSAARSQLVTDKNISGTPDLIVEIISPSTRDRDIRDKRNIYARFGVPFYWIIDPKPLSITELQLTGRAFAEVVELSREGVFIPRIFPDLKVDLARLFK